MANEKIIITINGGIIQDITNIPKGYEVEVRDFDTDDYDEDRLTQIDGEEVHIAIWEAV